jgi:putative cell wall-binding protein
MAITGVVSTGLALILTSWTGTPPAFAVNATPHEPDTPAVELQMGAYSASQFTADAQELPDGLVDAVQNDLGLSPAEYLAQAAAAADGAAVVADLKADGVRVVGSRMDGKALVVQVTTASDAAIVEQRGARAIIGEEPEDRGGFPSMHALADLLNGTGWGYSYAGTDYGCSIGFNGYNGTTGASEFVTAGHCIRGVEPGPVSPMTIAQTAPGGGALDAAIGSVLDPTFRFGDEYDSGLVSVTSASLVPKPVVSSWGWGQGSPGTGRMNVSGVTSGIEGASLCKSGITTGWTCGHIIAVDALVNVDGESVNAIISDACALPGDSGGPAMTGHFALGVLSAGNFSTCSQAGITAYFPMTAPSPYGSIYNQHTDWEPALTLNAPTVAGPVSRTGFVGDSLSGTVPGAVLGTYVMVYVDDEATPLTAGINPATKTWTVPLTGVAAGNHTWTAVTAHGSWSRSAEVSGEITLVPRPTVDRISGSDRYAAAVGISQSGFPDTAPVVYLVSGEKFPDALSAAPAAAKEGGPLLLTTSASLPTVVRDEIARLDPARIVVVGGVNSVSENVLTTLRTLAPTVERQAGDDRYAASRNLVDAVFGDAGAEVLYVATGANFPDALSASAAAGAKDSPVLLVPGGSSTLDSATIALVNQLAPDAIRIAGGVNSVSPGIQAALTGLAPSVTRLGGADRFAASQAINQDAFATAPSIYVANGFNFPDALAGAALAARNTSPLYVTPTTCLAQGLAAETGRLGATKLILLGGPNSLTPAVEQLMGC